VEQPQVQEPVAEKAKIAPPPESLGQKIHRLHFLRSTALTMEDIQFLTEIAALGSYFDRRAAESALKARMRNVVGVLLLEVAKLRRELKAATDPKDTHANEVAKALDALAVKNNDHEDDAA
jgi:hypothetical protein